MQFSSRLKYVNWIYSCAIDPKYYKGALRNLDSIKNYSFFVPLYATTHRPIFVQIQYRQCVEGGAKCIYGQTFSLLCRDCIADNLASREASQKEEEILDHFLAMQLHCNADLYAQALAACLARCNNFRELFPDPDNQAPDFELEHRLWAQS